MALHVFVAGESAQVAENLDANFVYLQQLIDAAGAQVTGTASGTSAAQARAFAQFRGVAAATGTSTTIGLSGSATQSTATAAATGTAGGTVRISAQTLSVANAGSVSTAESFSTTPSVAAATGTSDGTVVGSANFSGRGAATGTSDGTVVGARQINAVGSATGTSDGGAVGQGGATESTDPTSVTQSTQAIFFSATPGQPSTSLHSATLPVNPGAVSIDTTTDSSTSNAMELYYTGHVLYYQTTANTWFRWVSANTWNPTTSPIPTTIVESVEGKSLTSTTDTIYASSTVGSAAPSGATVGNGLDTWTLNANPGQIVHNGVVQDGSTAAGGVNSANVTQLYYHSHDVWQVNTQPLWWQWDGSSWQPPAGQATGPQPTTPTINVATIGPRVNLNETFVASGTYQAFSGTGNPVLQFADNVQSTSTSFNASDISGNITLSNSNETATTTAAVQSGVRSTTSRTAGKFMFEATASAITANWAIGVANSAFLFTANLGDDSNAIGFRPNWSGGNQAVVFNNVIQTSTTSQTDVNADKITICVDTTAEMFWVTSTRMRTAGNTWNNSASANPATNTGGINFTLDSGPYYICWSDSDNAGSVALNTLGPFAVAIPSGFAAWDSSTATVWQAFPSTVNVTPTSYSFVHPPITGQNPAARVSVRDSVSTGVVGVSNAFQVQLAGVVSLNPMTLSNTTFQAGQSAGTKVGTLSIPASGGTFTGTVASSNANFTVAGTGGTRTLQTAAVVGAGTYNTTLTATMANAVNSGETLAVQLTSAAESPQATDVTTVGPVIVGSSTPGTAGSQLTWAIVAGAAAPTVFDTEFDTFVTHRAWQSPDPWGYCATISQDGRGGPSFNESGTQWWTNPLNPSTPINNLYLDSNGILQLGVMVTPSADASYINTQAGATMPYVACLLNNQNVNYRKFGYYEYKVAVPKINGFCFDSVMEDYPASSTWNLEIDMAIGTNASGVQSLILQFQWASPSFATQTVYTNTSLDFTQFHVYGLNWQSDFITFYIDGTQVYQTATNTYGSGIFTTSSMFNYLLTATNYQQANANPPSASLPAYAQVDYFRVYATKPAAGGGNGLALNTITQTAFASVNEIYYIDHRLYLSTGAGPSWSVYSGAAAVGGQLTAGAFTSSSTPKPNIVLSSLTFPPGTNGSTGITAQLSSAGSNLSSVTWSEDSASFNFSGNTLNTTGSLPAGTYNLNITATIPA